MGISAGNVCSLIFLSSLNVFLNKAIHELQMYRIKYFAF